MCLLPLEESPDYTPIRDHREKFSDDRLDLFLKSTCLLCWNPSVKSTPELSVDWNNRSKQSPFPIPSWRGFGFSNNNRLSGGEVGLSGNIVEWSKSFGSVLTQRVKQLPVLFNVACDFFNLHRIHKMSRKITNYIFLDETFNRSILRMVGVRYRLLWLQKQ